MGTVFTLYTAAFGVYWLGTVIILVIGSIFRCGLPFLEFMRVWIKPLFWMNFVYFAVAELIFSAIYWSSYAFMRLTGFMSPMNSLFRMVQPSSGTDPELSVWLILSVILFLVIMTPYIFIHARVTNFFKRYVLKMLSPEFGITKSKFINQAPHKLLPSEFVRTVIGTQPTARNWIRSCSEPKSKNEFDIQTSNEDHMYWEYNGQSVNFWETQVEFIKGIPKKDSEGRTYHTQDWRTFFDGLAIRLGNVLPSAWDKTLFEITLTPKTKKLHRPIVKRGFFISIIEGYLQGKGKHGSQKNTKLEDYPESVIRIDIDGDHKFRYIGAEGKNLYMFIETDSDGSMFDFNMNIDTKDSLELFREDLELVKYHLNLSSLVINKIESIRASDFKLSA